jgi:hypothetical protein
VRALFTTSPRGAQDFTLAESMTLFVAVIVEPHLRRGAVLGAFVVLLPTLFNQSGWLVPVAFGLSLIVVMLFEPMGLAGRSKVRLSSSPGPSADGHGSLLSSDRRPLRSLRLGPRPCRRSQHARPELRHGEVATLGTFVTWSSSPPPLSFAPRWRAVSSRGRRFGRSYLAARARAGRAALALRTRDLTLGLSQVLHGVHDASLARGAEWFSRS